MDRQTAAPLGRFSHNPGENLKKAWLGLAARVLVGALLLASGALKAAEPVEELAVVIANYGVLSDSMTLTAAALLPWAEVLLGFCLIAGYFTRYAAVAGGALSAAFFAALSWVKLRGVELPSCGCFGQSVHLKPWQAMILDLLMILGATLAFKSGAFQASLDKWANSGYTPADGR